MPELNVNGIIDKLIVVSGSTFEMVDRETYLYSPDAGTNPESLLELCTNTANDDLRDCGFFIDEDVNVENMMEYAERIWLFLFVFNQDFFDELFATASRELDNFKNREVRSYATDEEDVLSEFVKALRIVFPDNAYLQHVQTTLENIEYRYNSTFVTYLQNIVTNIPFTDYFGFENDMENIQNFIKVMTKNRIEYKHCIELACSAYPDLNAQYLNNTVREYDRGKTIPENLTTFAWIVTVPDDQLSKDQKVFKKRTVEEHESQNTHHMEYYYKRNKTLIRENVVEVIAHHIEPDDTPEVQLQNIVKMFTVDQGMGDGSLLINKEYLVLGASLAKIFIPSIDGGVIDESFKRFTI